MAKLIFNSGEVEIPDGDPIKEKCRENNVPFGCEDGMCGTCTIEVESGEENLSEKNEKEKDMHGDDPKIRLACQCSIKSGEVKISNF